MINFILELVRNTSERITRLFRRLNQIDVSRIHIKIEPMNFPMPVFVLPPINIFNVNQNSAIAIVNNDPGIIQQNQHNPIENALLNNPALQQLMNMPPNAPDIQVLMAHIPPHAQGYNPGIPGQNNGFVFFEAAPAVPAAVDPVPVAPGPWPPHAGLSIKSAVG